MKISSEKRGIKPSYEIYMETVAGVPDGTYAKTIDLLCEQFGVEPKHAIRQLIVGRPIDQMVFSQYSPGVFRVWKFCMKKYFNGKRALAKEIEDVSHPS